MFNLKLDLFVYCKEYQKPQSIWLLTILTENFEYDVQKRIPSTAKAEKLVGFNAETSLDQMLDIVIPWMIDAREKGMY